MRPMVSGCFCCVAGSSSEDRNGSSVLPSELVPSGAVRLIELQEQGWQYLRP